MGSSMASDNKFSKLPTDIVQYIFTFTLFPFHLEQYQHHSNPFSSLNLSQTTIRQNYSSNHDNNKNKNVQSKLESNYGTEKNFETEADKFTIQNVRKYAMKMHLWEKMVVTRQFKMLVYLLTIDFDINLLKFLIDSEELFKIVNFYIHDTLAVQELFYHIFRLANYHHLNISQKFTGIWRIVSLPEKMYSNIAYILRPVSVSFLKILNVHPLIRLPLRKYSNENEVFEELCKKIRESLNLFHQSSNRSALELKSGQQTGAHHSAHENDEKQKQKFYYDQLNEIRLLWDNRDYDTKWMSILAEILKKELDLIYFGDGEFKFNRNDYDNDHYRQNFFHFRNILRIVKIIPLKDHFHSILTVLKKSQPKLKLKLKLRSNSISDCQKLRQFFEFTVINHINEFYYRDETTINWFSQNFNQSFRESKKDFSQKLSVLVTS